MKSTNLKEKTQQLMEAISKLETLEECKAFFMDLCSSSELNTIAKRIEVARLLHEGKTYREIIEITHAANATISRVKTAMENDNSVLRIVFQRMRAESFYNE